MRKRGSMILKALTAAGATAAITIFFKKLIAPQEVKAQVQLKSADLNQTKKKLQVMLQSVQKETSGAEQNEARRLTSALLSDCTASAANVLDLIQVNADILHNGFATTKLQKILNALMGSGITFLFVLAYFLFAYWLKLKLEFGASEELLAMLNTGIYISGAALVYSLCRVIYDIRSQSARKNQELTVGVEVNIADEQQDLFVDRQKQLLLKALEAAGTLSAKTEGTGNASSTMCNTMSEMLQYLYQAEAMNDMSGISGYLIPECKRELEKMGVAVVSEYNPETAYLFTVIDAPGIERSFVLKPALLSKADNIVVCTGEYVNSQ